MLGLSQKMSSDEFQQFTEAGYFTIRRTDKFWAGLPSDQVIETTLMRSLKSVGGLTHGRSTTESVKAQWIFGAAATTDICN